MILPDPGLTIWLYTPAADMRCQIDGLAALTTRKLQETPHNGALYVFTNRRRTLMKILYYRKGGYCLWSKRLERGQFQRFTERADKVPLNWTQLQCLIEGLDWKNMKKNKRYDR